MSVCVSPSITPSLIVVNSEENLTCPQCPKSFPNTRLLQQHQQSFHTDKAFICETCGKAFRFRSNLAEHRSVHTSHKPYVCKFCGKSSRLKDLTNCGLPGNLTKHILKHHKKEQNEAIAKDDIIVKKKPRFHENGNGNGNGVVVCAPSSSVPSPPAVLATINNNNIKMEIDDSSLYGLALTPSNIENQGPGHLPKEMTSEEERSILISLGLDYSTSIDLRDTPETSVSPDTYATKMEIDGDLCFDSPLPQETVGGETSLAALIAQVSSGSPDSSQGTQCPECGKHVRKSSYLPVHMTLHHGFPPPESGSLSDERNSEDYQSGSEDNMQGELRAIATAICDLKAQQLTTPKIEQVGVWKRETDTLLSGIDVRVSRLEKNLDMALNSIYTLVQLQTGINSSVNRLKEDAATKLQDIKLILEKAATTRV